jgi:tetratricopeptide (TPR) repeat protein
MKTFVLLAFCLSISLTPTYSQEGPWKTGIENFKAEKYRAAIRNFQEYRASITSKRPSTTFHIANSYYHLHELDSAIHYYQKTLHFEKISHINQRTVLRLSRCFLQKGDFEKAFNLTLGHLKENLNDEAALAELQDICLWAYLIKYEYLNAEYLTHYIKKSSYIINSVAAQKLIARNIRNESGHKFDSNRLEQIGLAQRWHGRFYNEEEEKSIHFIFENPDLIESIVVQEEKASKIMLSPDLPIHERLGAFYFLTPLDDEKIDLALEQEEEIFRLCTCLETPDYISNKYKKTCRKDPRALIKAAVEYNPAF